MEWGYEYFSNLLIARENELGHNNFACMHAFRISIEPLEIDSSSPLLLYARAVRRRHCVGGGASVNFGRRRRRAAGPKKSAAARAVKTFSSKIHEKISFYPQHFLVIEKCQKITKHTNMASAARRKIIMETVRENGSCLCVLVSSTAVHSSNIAFLLTDLSIQLIKLAYSLDVTIPGFRMGNLSDLESNRLAIADLNLYSAGIILALLFVALKNFEVLCYITSNHNNQHFFSGNAWERRSRTFSSLFIVCFLRILHGYAIQM